MLNDDASGSCFIELMEGTRKNKPKCTKIDLLDKMPDSSVGLARYCKLIKLAPRMRISLNSLIP